MTPAELFAIVCFISPNPSPVHWVVSGGEAQVAALLELAAERPAVRLVARAAADGIAFARFEFARDAQYRDVGGLIFEAQRSRLLISVPDQLVPSCPGGDAEEVGSPFHPVIVGLIGSEPALAALRDRLAWAQPSPMRLVDGRAGMAFRPDLAVLERYQAFVAEATAGRFEGVEIVLLRPGE